MKPNVCIYHAGCLDGFGAAWALRRVLDESVTDFVAANYNDTPPDVTNRNVYIVDFSYPLAVIQQMMNTAKFVTIIDHHKTAIEVLADYEHPQLIKVLDTTHSGAVLTWNYFYPGMQAPWLLYCIEDRDLWRFLYPETKAVNAFLFSHEFSFEVFDMIAQMDISEVAALGEPLVRNQAKNVAALISYGTRRMNIGGYDVPVVNANCMFASDIGNILSNGEPFAATYYDTGKGDRKFSLRAQKEGLDVETICRSLGGGGHPQAAGFNIAIKDCVEKGLL